MSAPPTPPRARRTALEHRDTHGTRADPYHWLRDDTRQDAEMLAHLRAENAYCDAVLAPHAVLEQAIYDEIVARLKPDDSSVPVFDNGYWYTARYMPDQQYMIHLRQAGSLDAPEEILIDGNRMAQDSDYFELGHYEISPDNRWMAYAIDRVGRREYEIRIRDLHSGEDLPDRIVRAEADLAWANDSQTLLYIAKDPETLLGDRVMAHRLGEVEDRLLYREEDDRFFMGVSRSKDGRWLLIGLNATLTSECRYADAGGPEFHFEPVIAREEAHEYEAEPLGEDFIIRSNRGARNFRLVRAPRCSAGDSETWVELIAGRDDAAIEDFDVHRDWLFVNERVDGLLRLRRLSWDGTLDQQVGPDHASADAATTMLDALPELDAPVLRYVHSSLASPASTYELDLRSGEQRLIKRQPVVGSFDESDYVSEHRRVTARDGARVPVSIVYRRGTALDGTAPALVYGYGAYGLSLDPNFSSSRLALLDRGFVCVIAHVRGGEELGRDWYDGGRLANKMNSFHDFIDVSEWLVQQGYAARDRLFASGGSAGGLLMGAVANLRPDLYAGMLAHVPFVDVLSTMLDDSLPLTTNEYDEWGDPAEADAYHWMLDYSPYDNVREQAYPAMRVTTGLWDSQVQYWEAAKWVARLREANSGDAPVLLQTELGAGHGGKSGRYERLHEVARDYAFLIWRAGLHKA